MLYDNKFSLKYIKLGIYVLPDLFKILTGHLFFLTTMSLPDKTHRSAVGVVAQHEAGTGLLSQPCFYMLLFLSKPSLQLASFESPSASLLLFIGLAKKCLQFFK